MAKPFTAYTQADYDAYVSANVSGFFHMTQLALDVMGKQGRGHLSRSRLASSISR